MLEKVRINISEEDSRLILGDRYRDSYLNAIRDFNLLYHLTGDQVYLEDAFEFSEKSKVAGLLTATRELNAVTVQYSFRFIRSRKETETGYKPS